MKEISLELRKEKLQKELATIERAERRLLIDTHYPEFKKLEGKFFKLDNGYNNKDRWKMYIKVTTINPSDVYDTGGNGAACHYSGWSFETTSSKEISIRKREYGYVHSLGKEITEKEFNEAWNKMIYLINNL